MSRSRILDEMHETAAGLYDAGIVDPVTMRSMNALCLPEVERLSAQEIKRLRLQFKLSQSVFAKYLNVKPVTVQKWELGEKRPSGAALKLLHVVQANGLSVLTNHPE